MMKFEKTRQIAEFNAEIDGLQASETKIREQENPCQNRIIEMRYHFKITKKLHQSSTRT